MTARDDTFSRVYHAGQIEQLMETLYQPKGASLLLEAPDSQPLPVTVRSQAAEPGLVLDLSATPEVASALSRGVGFRLLGSGAGGILRTPIMVLTHTAGPLHRLHCECPYPLYLEVMQRRDTFRATLRAGMDVGVVLTRTDWQGPLYGDLKDLSLEGALVELSAPTAGRLGDEGPPLELALCFPEGSRLQVRGRPRHQHADAQRGVVRVGFAFEPSGTDVERRLWFYVREIEREAARYQSRGKLTLRPSALFTARGPSGNPINRRAGDAYALPMAGRLAATAGFLDTQIPELRQGGRIDGTALSRHAERLLALHDEDREALLFATQCLHKEPLLVRHGLAVATRLLDLAVAQGIPRPLCKAVVGAALVHDLGKALLPEELVFAEKLDAAQYQQLQSHVERLRACLSDCGWLAPAVVEAVIECINERLDGSGYPNKLSGEQLAELARLAAVVDVADALARPRADRAAWPMGRIYRHLLDSPERFDGRWVKRYIERFGRCPVGTLVAYPSGGQAWVRSLNAKGQPREVWTTKGGAPPNPTQGEIVTGEELARMGEPTPMASPDALTAFSAPAPKVPGVGADTPK